MLRNTEDIKTDVLSEIEYYWDAYECREKYDSFYQFVDSGEYERQAFYDWYWNEETLPVLEDIIDNANRIQMLRDTYLEMCI